MLKNMTKPLLFGLSLLLWSPSLAHSEDWSFEGSFYLFAAETKLGVGGTEGKLSFSDALDNLDMAGMGAIAASNGKWTLIADLMYFDLGFENDTPGNAFSGLDTDSKTTILSVAALYRVHGTPQYTLDLGGGFRYFNTDSTLTLLPGNQPQQRITDDDSWTDPVIAARARLAISDQWSATLGADYGSFVSDRKTYQAILTFDYAFAENWSARFGYRYTNVENDDKDFRFEQSGPVLGVTYKF